MARIGFLGKYRFANNGGLFQLVVAVKGQGLIDLLVKGYGGVSLTVFVMFVFVFFDFFAHCIWGGQRFRLAGMLSGRKGYWLSGPCIARVQVCIFCNRVGVCKSAFRHCS